jgi:hypothetical protein
MIVDSGASMRPDFLSDNCYPTFYESIIIEIQPEIEYIHEHYPDLAKLSIQVGRLLRLRPLLAGFKNLRKPVIGAKTIRKTYRNLIPIRINANRYRLESTNP